MIRQFRKVRTAAGRLGVSLNPFSIYSQGDGRRYASARVCENFEDAVAEAMSLGILAFPFTMAVRIVWPFFINRLVCLCPHN